MKFQVAKSDLEFALTTVAGALAAGDADISSHFVFRILPGTTDQVQVLAASNRIYSHCTIPKAKVTEEGPAFTIEGWRLKGWVGMVGDVVLDVETMDNAEIQFKGGKYVQRFRSLDVVHFQFMDKTVANSTQTGKIEAKRLSAALKAAKSFASTDDSNKPDVVVLDIKNGLLMATDKSSVVVFFTLKDMANVSMRIHVKDVSGVSGFLDSTDGDVEILDAKRIVFLKRVSDGALYGETRYQIDFPSLNYSDETDQRLWVVKTADLRKAAQHGFFGASKTDPRMFIHPFENDQIKVSMKTDTNTGTFVGVYLDCVEKDKVANAPDVSKDGFPVSFPHVMALLDAFGDKEFIELGVNVDPVKKKRYIRVTKKVFEDDKDGSFDKYVFVLAGMVW
jgi:hypothetical protein